MIDSCNGCGLGVLFSVPELHFEKLAAMKLYLPISILRPVVPGYD